MFPTVSTRMGSEHGAAVAKGSPRERTRADEVGGEVDRSHVNAPLRAAVTAVAPQRLAVWQCGGERQWAAQGGRGSHAAEREVEARAAAAQEPVAVEERLAQLRHVTDERGEVADA